MPVQVPRPDPLIEEAVVLELPNDAPAEGFTSAHFAVAKSGRCWWMQVRFAGDSPLEEAGFELVVPL